MKDSSSQNSAAERPDHVRHYQEKSVAIPGHETRSSDSPFVEQIGSICAEKEYTPLCPADGHWHLLLVRYHGETSLSVWGPTTKAATMPYHEGTEFLYITFTPYALEREIEDLAALINEAGGSALVFGYSSGALLTLMAAASGLSISRLALYEPPFLLDEGYPKLARDISVRLSALIASGQRGDAVELYQTEIVGIPADIVARVRQAPFRPALETIAHTLVYDATILGDIPVLAEQLPAITIPTLMISGEDSPAFLRKVTQAVADALPNAQHRSLAGQTHDLVPAVLAPVLEAFFAKPQSS